MRAYRHLWIFLLPLFCSLTCLAQDEVNNIFRSSESWLDTDGEVINAHSGGFIFHEGKYFWFGEHRDAGRKQYATWQGVRCYSSYDLYNWKNEGIILEVVDDPNAEITKGCNIERPKVIYNEKTGKFVMWFHLELKGQGYNAAKTAVAIADTPIGPYTFIKSYRPNAGQWPINFKEDWKNRKEPTELAWWTDDWREEVKKGMFVRRDFEKGQMSRDMTLFVDDDGTAYHIHSSEENLTLHISKLTDDYLSFTGEYVTLDPAGHNEAPAVFKKDDTYFIITSGCTGWAPNAARSFKSKSMFGPWESLGNPCQGEDAHLTFQSQSTFILPIQNKEDAFIYMGDRWNAKTIIDSKYIWLPLRMENEKPVLEWYDEWNLNIFNKTNN